MHGASRRQTFDHVCDAVEAHGTDVAVALLWMVPVLAVLVAVLWM